MVPGPLHKGTIMNFERGNNLGIPRDDFLFLLGDLGPEMEDDEKQPCPGFHVPVDKEEANIIVTINSKEPFAEPDDMKFWWRIFYAAKEDWTVSSTNWEGVNWGLFSFMLQRKTGPFHPQTGKGSTGACFPEMTKTGKSRWAAF
jgi:hypothetical protein